MRAIDTISARKPSTAGLAGDVWRAFLACGFLLVVCVSGVVIAIWSRGSPSPAARSHATSEADLRSGSVLVVSPTGDLCRERIIDNSTWRIRNNGSVDCEEALAKASGGDRVSPGSRLDMIREGFRGRP